MTDGFVKMETENYKFFQHKACEFFPCHETKDIDNFNCLFCYCPLYALGENCGGNFKILENGVKDCSIVCCRTSAAIMTISDKNSEISWN